MTAKVGVIIPVRATKNHDAIWLGEAVGSLKRQTFQDWECIIVNDNSTVDFTPIKGILRDPRISAVASPTEGVSSARNAGLARITAPLVFPLDHDDLLEDYVLKTAVEALEANRECRMVYGDIELLTGDSRRIVEAPPFSFNLLKQALFLPVGSMHYTEDARKIGGWSPDMDQGLEDWEYWMRLVEAGVCGLRIEKVMYTYRRHAEGRLAFLRTHPENFMAAQTKMRAIHADYYSGAKEVPMCVGCGGGFRPANRVVPGARAAASMAPQTFAADATMPQVLYIGGMNAEFQITALPSRRKYVVPGSNRRVLPVGSPNTGVAPEDVDFFLAYDRGRAFSRVL